MKTQRKQLLFSIISLMLCFSMLLGTTYAWFTDSVTSVDNIIKAGNLDIAMYWNDDLSDNWKNVEEPNNQKIFDYDKWEPGYTEVRYVKIVNEGNLAFKYTMDILPLGAVSALANVIDVYFLDPAVKITDRTRLTAPVGTLAQVIAGNIPASGKLENKDDSVTVGIALKMREDAGNEYQGLSIGDSFTVQLMATQLASEQDAFDNKYDEQAPMPSIDQSASADVTLDASGNVASEVTIAGEAASATVPAGVKAAEGTTSMTLTVTEILDSKANVTVTATEVAASLDVHVKGVAADNTKPIAIELPEYLPVGLNMGNYRLYHVENGQTNAMTLLADGETPAHNTFTYDPATGDVTLYMATFSEVKFVAETESKWEGKRDYSWYTNAVSPIAEGEPDYVIANADQLAALSAIVGGMDGQIQDSFTGKTVKLVADINLGDKESENNPKLIFYPIGYYNSEGTYEKTDTAITSGFYTFEGTFDGNGNTIANFYQNTWEMKGDNNYYDAALQYYRDGMGLFGRVYGGTVKNLTVENFSSDGEYTTTGVIAAYADGATFENVAILNCNPRVYNIGNGGIVGCVGWYAKEANLKTTFTNITVDNSNKISALWGSYDVACGGIVGQYYPTSGQDSTLKNAGIHMENCHVSAIMDVYNDVCGNYQYYAYRYAGMLIGSIRENTTNEDGKTIPDMTGISAEGCTVNYGDWNDYYYCEFESNGHPSYSGPDDYKFSRVPHSELSFTDTNGNGLVDADERASVTGCKHNHTNAENNKAIYLPFHQLFTGYGWGVNSIGLEKYSGIVTNLDITEGDQQESVVKFEEVGLTEIPNGTAISVGDLFSAITNNTVAIKPGSLMVSVEALDENGNISAVFNRDDNDWENSTITISGTGSASITIQDYYFCTPTSVTVTVVEASEYQMFDLVFENTEDYLYRVGNQNAVELQYLFSAKLNKTVTKNNANISITPVAGNVTGSVTPNLSDWSKGSIKFENTGVVTVTISVGGTASTTLNFEVVTATNKTTASFSGNTVLLKDVTVSTSTSASGVVYGNGFTVNMENAVINEKNGAVFHLYDGTILKNLRIVGKEFTTVATTVNDTNYGVSAVRAWGTVTIENCYISGCRSAVSVTGTALTIKDSVIANGVYANIDFRSGILNLHNVTTINEPHTVNGTTVVGLGIVGNMTASAGRQINITGTLTQYNWISQSDCSNIKASGLNNIFKSVFTEDTFAPLRYNYDGVDYVNTGILSLSSSDFGQNNVSDIPTGYTCLPVTGTIGNTSMDGFVWTFAEGGTLTDNDMKYHDEIYQWLPTEQGTSYIPSAFDYSKAGLTAENGVVQIEYESGKSYTLSADTISKLFAATKYGTALSYTVTMNGVDYTGKDIVLNATASQTYTVIFTITDNLVYDKDGKLSATTYEAPKELKIFATVVDKSADAPTFTFYYGTNGSASAGTPHTTQPTNSYTSTIKQVGEDYYIMPNVTATSANAIGSQTVDNEIVYYPIVDGINVRSGSSTDYDFTRYYPIFKAVKISDNGTEYFYTSTTEMPATVAWASATIDSGNGASALNDGFGLYNNQYLCKIQKKAGDAESGGTSVVKYSYTALDGNTYYYYVGYRFYDENEGGVCITPDTLITLADGTQKRVDALTGHEELLVWNHETGLLESAPIAYIVDHEGAVSECEILHLTFDNGKTVKIIGEHVFFDAAQNKYVAIDGETADSLVGHTFLALSADGTAMERVQLISVTHEMAETAVYEVVSYKHLTCFTEGILSTSAFLDPLLNIFDVDSSNWMYNAEQVQRDVETYGLYTYADFDGLISKEAFELYNAAYLKIAVGKGIITWNDILDLIDIYFNAGVDPIN